MDTRTYIIAGPTELHLGPDDIYKPGDTVELPEDMAAPLLADSVIVEPAQRPEGDALSAAIREAAARLDPADESNWTKSGKPRTEALEGELGFDVSADERDAALAEIEAARKDSK